MTRPCFQRDDSLLRFAQYAFIRTDCAFRLAGLRPLRLAAVFTGAVIVAANGFFGGRPRRLIGVPKASIARLSLSLARALWVGRIRGSR